MTLDDGYVNQAEERRRALERDHARDEADRLHELQLRDEAESVEAAEAYWQARFARSAGHYSASQQWDGT